MIPQCAFSAGLIILTLHSQRARFLQSQGATEENSSDFAQIMQVIRAYQNQQRRPMFQQGMQQSSASPVQAAAPPQQMQPQQPRPFMAPADPNALAGTYFFALVLTCFLFIRFWRNKLDPYSRKTNWQHSSIKSSPTN